MNSSYKTGLITALLLFFVYSTSYSQKIYFCDGVDKNDDPINPSSTFLIDKDDLTKLNPPECEVYVLTKLGDICGCASISYEVYKIDDKGNEVYYTSAWQGIELDATSFGTEIILYDPGEFIVYIYDDWKDVIVTGSFEIKLR